MLGQKDLNGDGKINVSDTIQGAVGKKTGADEKTKMPIKAIVGGVVGLGLVVVGFKLFAPTGNRRRRVRRR